MQGLTSYVRLSNGGLESVGMTWDELVKKIDLISSTGSGELVSGVEYDSRKVRFGSVFVAIRGGTTDGNLFVESALAQKASGLITDSLAVYERMRAERPGTGSMLVERGRRALSQAASTIFNDPQRHLSLSAVTGTNGKTTTAFLLEQLLQSVGRKCVLIGTVEYHIGDEVRPSFHTTPESRDILEFFAEGVQRECTEAVMEVSSHALEQERVWGLPVDVAIFTNLTQDHLDYHGTMEAYAAAKAKLFRGQGTSPPRVSVLNADDAWGRRILQGINQSEVLSYGIEAAAEFRAQDLRLEGPMTQFGMTTPVGEVMMRSPLRGKVNVYNLLAASAAAWSRGVPVEQIAKAAEDLRQVPGRFEIVPSEAKDILVVVDYAHTDDALRNLTAMARGVVRHRGGRVITMFGCGGDRDRTKRSRMGKVAGEGSDLVIVTSDNPRSEEPMAIIEEAAAGARLTKASVMVEEDRSRAIETAIHLARPGDIVLIAGKGHEKVQILRDRTIPFDDVAVAAAVLQEMRCV